MTLLASFVEKDMTPFFYLDIMIELPEWAFGSLYTIGACIGVYILYLLVKYDSWRKKNILRRIPVTADKNWKYVGKKNDVPLKDIPILVTEMRESFFTHKTFDVYKRIEQLQQLYRLLQENDKMILDALKTDLHRNEFEGTVYDIAVVKEDIQNLIKGLPKWSRPQCYGRSLLTLFSRGYFVPEPYGVTLVIGTWNYPFMLCFMPLAAALCAGNVCVVKPSNVSPHCSQLITTLLRQYMDPSIVQVVGSDQKGDRATTTALLEEKWDYIFFTGNHKIGRIVMEKAAQHLTPVTLELGGKNPVIITKHADLYLAAKRVLCSRCFNGGQQCVSPDYVLIEREVEEAFYAMIRRVEKENMATIKEEMGRIIDDRHYDTICGFYQASEKAIGQVVIGGKQAFEEEIRYIPPTVLAMTSLDCPLMTEELFSPILPVFPVESYEEAIQICNRREKPLSLYIFSEKDAEVQDIAFATSSGGVTINNCLLHVIHPDLYFGGVGQSGMGGYHGYHSFKTFSHMKPVVYKTKWPGIPLIYDFPLMDFPLSAWKTKLARLMLWGVC